MDQAFYLGASMSMISMFGAGIAMGAPKLPVWVFMGDGAFVMNPGMLMVERDLNLPNLKHFLVSNREDKMTTIRKEDWGRMISFPARTINRCDSRHGSTLR